MTTTQTYFASGSNKPAEIRGFARIGHPVGVAFPSLSRPAIAELLKLRNIPLFVDSGAFSEVEFTAAGPVVVKPITAADWTRILSLYLRLAKALGGMLYVVAPDMVGFQAETLERLARYAPALRQIRELGANILVPIQKGELSQADFDAKVAAVLGFDDYVRAMPCNKSATTAAELDAFVEARRPARVHLLGLGVRNRAFDRYAAAATKHGAELFCDSCLITGSVGRSNGRANMPSEVKGGRRVYTIAKELAELVIAEGLSSIANPRELGIVLAFARIEDEAARWAMVEAQLAARRASRVAAA